MRVTCKKCACTIKLNISAESFKGKSKIAFDCPKCKHTMTLKMKKEEPSPTQTSIFSVKKTKKFVLIHLNTDSKFELNQPYMTFGRQSDSSKADLQCVTDDFTMSRKHCVFRKSSQGLTIQDVSSNGTSVQGKRILPNEEIYLNHEDEIEMGDQCFKLLIE